MQMQISRKFLPSGSNMDSYWLPQNIWIFSKNGLNFQKTPLFYVSAASFMRLLIENRVSTTLYKKKK